MKRLIAAAAFVAVAFSSSFAGAVGLSTTGGDAFTLTGGFSLNATTGLSAGDSIQRYTDGGTAGALNIGGTPREVTFEYLGSEASNYNSFVDLSGGGHDVMFQNKYHWTHGSASSVYDTDTAMVNDDGALGFEFESDRSCWWVFLCRIGEAENGGDIDKGFSIGLFKESNLSYIVLFGDGTGDSDMDDMAVRISVVPVPAALPLFGAALLGMGFLARRRKQKAALQA